MVLKVFLFVTSLFGTLAIYNFVAGNVYEDPDLLISLGGAYSFIEDFRGQFQESDYFHSITGKIVSGCISEECMAKHIFKNLSYFSYEPGEDSNPVTIWKEKAGDCDEMSYLYMTMLKAEGINSRVQCNHNHCWNIIFLGEKRIIADIVNDEWAEY